MGGLFLEFEPSRGVPRSRGSRETRTPSDGTRDDVEASRRRRGRGRHAIEATSRSHRGAARRRPRGPAAARTGSLKDRRPRPTATTRRRRAGRDGVMSTRTGAFCLALSRFSWCFAALSASSSWMCLRCSCILVKTFSFSIIRAISCCCLRLIDSTRFRSISMVAAFCFAASSNARFSPVLKPPGPSYRSDFFTKSFLRLFTSAILSCRRFSKNSYRRCVNSALSVPLRKVFSSLGWSSSMVRPRCRQASRVRGLSGSRPSMLLRPLPLPLPMASLGRRRGRLGGRATRALLLVERAPSLGANARAAARTCGGGASAPRRAAPRLEPRVYDGSPRRKERQRCMKG